jgi:hypothetical protein
MQYPLCLLKRLRALLLTYLNVTDIWSKTKRPDVISRIRGSGNDKTELQLAKIGSKIV